MVLSTVHVAIKSVMDGEFNWPGGITQFVIPRNECFPYTQQLLVSDSIADNSPQFTFYLLSLGIKEGMEIWIWFSCRSHNPLFV